jgi:tRNA-dependent cyclodipeptide synthase
MKSKISVLAIHPRKNLKALAGANAFLGISLSGNLTTNQATALLSWGQQHFASISVLIGDYIERHNIAAELGCSLSKATNLAMERARPIKTTFDTAILATAPQKSSLLSAHPIILSPEFPPVYKLVRDCFETDTEFKAAVLADVYAYLLRRAKRRESVSTDTHVSSSVSYLLEEMAMFAVIANRGWTVQLYPGRHLSVLVAIATKKLKCEIPGLSEMTFVDLHIPKENPG